MGKVCVYRLGNPGMAFFATIWQKYRAFSVGNAPRLRGNIPWIGEGVPWISKSMGGVRRSFAWMCPERPSAGWSEAGKRADEAVRFNALPNGAHGAGCRRAGKGLFCCASGRPPSVRGIKESGALSRRTAFPTSERKKNLSCMRARRPAAGYGLRTLSSPSSSCMLPGCFRA